MLQKLNSLYRNFFGKEKLKKKEEEFYQSLHESRTAMFLLRDNLVKVYGKSYLDFDSNKFDT